MKRFYLENAWLVCSALVIFMAGCMGGTAPQQFFMLDPIPARSTNPASAVEQEVVRIRIDPVEVPGYLNRPQIVTHLDRAEYEIDEYNRWLEPLDGNLTRVIAENLAELLRDEGIDVLSMSRPVDTPYTLAIQVLRLDGKPGGEAALAVRWTLFQRSDNTVLRSTRSVYKENAGDPTYQAFLQAQNRMIESLSREIADGIKPVVQRRRFMEK